METRAIVPEEAGGAVAVGSARARSHLTDSWPVAVGLLVLYVPTYLRLARDYWVQPEYAHGPIVLCVMLWLAWRGRGALAVAAPPPTARGTLPAILLLATGLCAYVLGRSQDIPLLEVGSQLPVAAGAILLLRGRAALGRLWFALFFLLFLVPLPGLIVDPLTGQLKQFVSAAAESLLYAAGYPIARSGVVLSIGPYQLLVADACSGMHSLFTMASMGLLYIHLTHNGSRLRYAILAASLLPVAVAANVVRVVALVLVTWRFGDEAGQGFIHGFSGILLFGAGLLILFALDTVLAALGIAPDPDRSEAS